VAEGKSNVNGIKTKEIMKKFKLHYAKIDLEGDIPCYETNSHDLIIDKLDSLMYGNLGKIVYLISIGEEIYISQYNTPSIGFVLRNLSSAGGVVWYQEYPSFEEAYTVALSMKEGETDLCYSSETKSSPYWNKACKEFIDKTFGGTQPVITIK